MIVVKIVIKSLIVVVMVMVLNSLGFGELFLYYGIKE